jgi:hypothetical protein
MGEEYEGDPLLKRYKEAAEAADVAQETLEAPIPDPIEAAIDATEVVPEPDHLIADFAFRDGTTMKLIVPIDFDADKFETAVATLMQLRVAADQRKASMNPIVVPQARPTLVRPDGRPLT